MPTFSYTYRNNNQEYIALANLMYLALYRRQHACHLLTYIHWEVSLTFPPLGNESSSENRMDLKKLEKALATMKQQSRLIINYHVWGSQ